MLLNVSTGRSLLQAGNTGVFYGISWDEVADVYARTGILRGKPVGTSLDNTQLQIQAGMRRCVLNTAGQVVYYLDAADSTKKLDGSAAVLTGADGQVMVEIPAFYLRYSYIGTTHRWDISLTPQAGFSLHPAFVKNGVAVANRYIGAYEGVLYDVSASMYANGIYQTAFSCTFAAGDKSITAGSRTAPLGLLAVGDNLTISGTTSNNGTFTVASLVSGVKITVAESLTNETAAGTVIATQTNWTASTGDMLASVSSKSPITQATRAQFRAAARNRGAGWRQLDIYLLSAVQLLYLVEYASFSSQTMIGVGITNAGDWLAYNDYNPINKTGQSDAAGNATQNTAGASTGAAEVGKYLSYRGIENWFGHLWKFVDGININNNVPYVSNVDTQFADDTAANYTNLGVTLSAVDGYQTKLAQIGAAFLPTAVGGSSASKIPDYYYQAAGWRVGLFGGDSLTGAPTGEFCWALSDASGFAYQSIGARLCY
jgi:hypothetical protein